MKLVSQCRKLKSICKPVSLLYSLRHRLQHHPGSLFSKHQHQRDGVNFPALYVAR